MNIDKLAKNAGTIVAWDWGSVARKSDEKAILVKLVELTNILRAKGATCKVFEVAATKKIVENLRLFARPNSDHPHAVGVIQTTAGQWVLNEGKSERDNACLAVKGGGKVGFMSISNLNERSRYMRRAKRKEDEPEEVEIKRKIVARHAGYHFVPPDAPTLCEFQPGWVWIVEPEGYAACVSLETLKSLVGKTLTVLEVNDEDVILQIPEGTQW
jgi:hypothetical protein